MKNIQEPEKSEQKKSEEEMKKEMRERINKCIDDFIKNPKSTKFNNFYR